MSSTNSSRKRSSGMAAMSARTVAEAASAGTHRRLLSKDDVLPDVLLPGPAVPLTSRGSFLPPKLRTASPWLCVTMGGA